MQECKLGDGKDFGFFGRETKIDAELPWGLPKTHHSYQKSYETRGQVIGSDRRWELQWSSSLFVFILSLIRVKITADSRSNRNHPQKQTIASLFLPCS